jgi:hypothetical protein
LARPTPGYLQEAFGAVRAAAASTAAPPPVDGTHSVVVLVLWLVAITAVAAGVIKVRDIA